jgi:Protein of unknown function (DUF4013)
MGLLAVALFPLLFIPLFGYAVHAVRAAQVDGTYGPPPWQWSARLFSDGAWVALVVAFTAAPFALAYPPLATALGSRFGDLVGGALAFFGLLLVWGFFMLLLLPHAVAHFAATGRLRDLVDIGAAVRGVRRDFATWNVVVAAIVTAWAVGLACAGLACVGVVPGLFYAILVSAHAAAALERQGSGSPTR